MKLTELFENHVRDAVFHALDNAMANDYMEFLVGHSDLQVADDLVKNDSDLENYDRDQILPYVKAWRQKNKADLVKKQMKESLSPEEKTRILKMGFRHGLAGEKLPNVAGVKSSDMKLAHPAYEAGKKLREKLGAENIPPFKNEAGKQHREFDNFANKHFERLGLVSEAMQKVYLSQTQSGKQGFFTKGYLVIPLSKEEFERASKDEAFAAKLAHKHHLEYEPKQVSEAKKYPTRVLVWVDDGELAADAQLNKVASKLKGEVGNRAYRSGDQMVHTYYFNKPDNADKFRTALDELSFVEKVVVNYEYEG